MIKDLINGYNGKMGQMVLDQIEASKDFECIGGTDVSLSINEITEKPDVIIDFSTPEASLSILQYAKKIKFQ